MGFILLSLKLQTPMYLVHYPLGDMPPVKSVAIIGAGPTGAISVDALVQEREFDTIRM